MEKISLVIIDDNVEFLKMLECQAADSPVISLLGMAAEAEEGLALVRAHNVDACLVDLVMPGQDGFFFLNELKKLDKKPVTVVISGMNSPAVIKMAAKLGADHFVSKPLCIKSLFDTIAELCKNRSATPTIDQPIIGNPIIGRPSAVDLYIQTIMDPLPVNQRLMGYRFLQTAVRLSIEDPGMLDAITKILYPTVAKKHKSSASRVERAIRHMIGVAWDADENLLKNLLAVKNRPTNGQFIAAIADRYKLFGQEQV